MSESPLKLQSERIKRQKIMDESKFLIYNKSGKLTSPGSQGKETFIRCFFQRPERKDDGLGIKCFINKETKSFQDDISSSIRWHKASFTSKKNMTSALKHMDDDNVFKGQCSEDSSEPSISTRSKVCTNIDFKSVCFFL